MLERLDQQNRLPFLYSFLNQLDQEYSHEIAEETIRRLFEAANAARWAIGDILVFLRFKLNFDTIKIFHWNTSDAWPPNFTEYTGKELGVKLHRYPDPWEFVCWQAFRLEKYWVLRGNFDGRNEVRIWRFRESQQVMATREDEFEAFMETLGERLLKNYTDAHLNRFYHVSFCFPPGEQNDDKSWSYYYEVVNLASHLVSDGLTREERLEEKRWMAQRLKRDLIAEGVETSVAIRKRIRALNDSPKNYPFAILESLWLAIEETGERVEILRFEPGAKVHDHVLIPTQFGFLQRLQAATMPTARYVWKEDKLYNNIRSMDLVATLNIDHPEVMRLCIKAALTYNWNIIEDNLSNI